MMAYEALQLVIGLALIDLEFREMLLNERAKAIVGLPLNEEEAAVILSIKATTLKEFSIKLDRWIDQKARATGARPMSFAAFD
ncbi:MAG: hypothetical protein HW403_340 [Dehalococcoidia bacterium]|nr:hypothetical protein [Dehalococcoidia bacterium]